MGHCINYTYWHNFFVHKSINKLRMVTSDPKFNEQLKLVWKVKQWLPYAQRFTHIEGGAIVTSFHLVLCWFRKLWMPKFYFRGMTRFQDVIRHADFCMMGIDAIFLKGKCSRIWILRLTTKVLKSSTLYILHVHTLQTYMSLWSKLRLLFASSRLGIIDWSALYLFFLLSLQLDAKHWAYNNIPYVEFTICYEYFMWDKGKGKEKKETLNIYKEHYQHLDVCTLWSTCFW